MSKIKCGAYRPGQPAKYAHQKADGMFVRVTKSNVTTSHPSDITESLRAIRPDLVPVHLRSPDIVLLGELHVATYPASMVKSVLAGNEKSLESLLRIDYFAIEDLPPESGASMLYDWPLEVVRDTVEGWHLPFAPFIALEDGWSPDTLLDEAAAMGIEGWVLKDGNLLNWRKLKQVKTIDCVVTGYEPGRGKYAGLLGALVVGVYVAGGGPLVTIANVSGMDDAERIRMSDVVIDQLEDPDYTGTLVVECAYQYVGAGGRLRHPRFVGWRDDKAPWECTTAQDPDLEEFYDARP